MFIPPWRGPQRTPEENERVVRLIEELFGMSREVQPLPWSAARKIEEAEAREGLEEEWLKLMNDQFGPTTTTNEPP